MAETLNLTRVNFTHVNEDVNLIIEEGHELKRLNLEETFGALDNIVAAEDKNNDGNIVLRLFTDGSPEVELDTSPSLGSEGKAAESKAVAEAIENAIEELKNQVAEDAVVLKQEIYNDLDGGDAATLGGKKENELHVAYAAEANESTNAANLGGVAASEYAKVSTVNQLNTNISNLQNNLNNLKLQTITLSEYNSLSSKDSNTLYIITE